MYIIKTEVIKMALNIVQAKHLIIRLLSKLIGSKTENKLHKLRTRYVIGATRILTKLFRFINLQSWYINWKIKLAKPQNPWFWKGYWINIIKIIYIIKLNSILRDKLVR